MTKEKRERRITTGKTARAVKRAKKMLEIRSLFQTLRSAGVPRSLAKLYSRGFTPTQPTPVAKEEVVSDHVELRPVEATATLPGVVADAQVA